MEQITKLARPTYTSAERAQWIARYRSSGLNQVQFAQQHGVKLKTLQGWLYRQPRRRAASAVAQKTRGPEPKQPPTTSFCEIKAPALGSDPPSAGWAAEVTWPSGVTVRLGAEAEAAWIAALLEAVRRTC